MAQIIGGFSTISKKFIEANTVSVDNWSFKLFYKWSTSLLGLCSFLTTARQLFGQPIRYEDRSQAVYHKLIFFIDSLK